MISGSSIALELSQCVVVPSVCRLSSLAGRCVLSVRRPLSSRQFFYLASQLQTCCFAHELFIPHTHALITAGYCSNPVRHFSRITWHPTSTIAREHKWIKALILDKLLAACGDIDETCKLQNTRFRVVDVTWITPLTHPSTRVLSSLSWLLTVTPTPFLSIMSRVTLYGGTLVFKTDFITIVA